MVRLRQWRALARILQVHVSGRAALRVLVAVVVSSSAKPSGTSTGRVVCKPSPGSSLHLIHVVSPQGSEANRCSGGGQQRAPGPLTRVLVVDWGVPSESGLAC